MTHEISSVTVNGQDARYCTKGEGETLLVLHTSGGPLWTPLLDLYATMRRVVMPVLPGFGGMPAAEGVSDVAALADWVAAFLDAFGAEEPVDVFGGSFGGRVALYLAARHKDKVVDLVLEAPSGAAVGAEPGVPAAGPLVLFAHPEKAEGLLPSPEEMKANSEAFHAFGGPVDVDAELLLLLPAIDAQVLVIMGTLDALTPPEAGRYLAATLPNAKVTYVYDAGHGVQVDQPEAMFRVTRHFLDKGSAFIVASREYA